MKKRQYYIGIDLGGTNTRIALVSKNGKVIARRTLKTANYKRGALINKIIDSIKEMLLERKLKRKNITGIGAGLAGLVDSKKGIVRYLVNIPGWRNVNLKALLETRLGIKTSIDNDVNLMTLGELCHGAGRSSRNLICITLGTGVGGGVVIDGRLYHGTASAAGEIGHIPINEKGPRCNCGGRACVESYIGNRYLMKKLGKKSTKYKSLESIDKAARMGDRFAVEFWKDVGTKLGVMLTGVINFLNPERIVIGGGIAKAGRFLFDPLRKTVKKRAMRIQTRTVKIVKAALGEDAGVIGASVLARLNAEQTRNRRGL